MIKMVKILCTLLVLGREVSVCGRADDEQHPAEHSIWLSSSSDFTILEEGVSADPGWRL